MVTKYSSYQENRSFSDSHHDEIKQILKDNLMHITSIEIANDHQDMNEGTDYVIHIEGGTIAGRVRRPDCKYRDFTIRAVNKGYKTEIDKLREGFGDWYLYCWTNEYNRIDEWILVDINKIRKNSLLEHRTVKDNGESTGFIHIEI